MAGPVRIAILADARNAVAGMRKVSGEASSMGSKIKGVGSSMKGAFVAAGAAVVASGIIDGFKKTVDAAADLSAAIGTTKQIFKGNADEMLNWSKTAATSLGLSQAEALNATKTFGGFFTAVGIGTKQSATMSKSWATMAGNLAAFADLPTADAIDAISGALRGELDPLQKYIPTISAAAIQQKAMAQTGKKNAAALTQQEKAAAINALLMDSVANKAGAAERAQGGYAVQMGKLKAQFTDISAQIGMLFLPGITKAGAFVNDRLIPGVKDFATKYGPGFKAALGKAGSALKTAFNIGPVKKIMDSFKAPGGLDALKTSFKGIGGSLKELGQSDQVVGIVDKVKTGFMSLSQPITNMVNTVKPIIDQLAVFIATTFQKYLPQIKAVFGTIGQIVASVFEVMKIIITTATSVIQTVWSNFGANILNVVSTAFGSVIGIVQGVFTIVKGIFDVIIGVLTGDWGRAWGGVKSVVMGAVGILRAAFNVIKSIVMLGVAVVVRVMGAAWNAVKAVTASVWAAIKGAIASAWGAIRGAVSSAIGAVKGAISTGWAAVKSATSSAWGAIKSAVSNGVNGVLSYVRALPGKIRGAMAGAGGWLVGAGRDLIQGMINGVAGMAGAIADKARSVVSGAVSAAKGALGIHSPSKVFAKIGEYVGLGFINGLAGTIPKIVSTMDRLTKLVKDAFKGKQESSWLKRIRTDTASLLKDAKKRDAAVASMKTAQAKLKELLQSKAEVINNIRDTFSQSFTLVDQAAQEGDASIGGILDRSGKAVAQAIEFAQQLKDLRTRGLSPDVLRELASSGPDAGAATARALLDASQSQLAELNNNYKELAKSGTEAGTVIGEAMYDAGVSATEGLIKGLASQQAAMDAAMRKIALRLRKELGKAMGIKLPALLVSTPKVKPVAAAPVKAPKATPVATPPMAERLAPIVMNVNTGVIVDKRGLVDTIASAVNEVATQLGRPVKLAVEAP